MLLCCGVVLLVFGKVVAGIFVVCFFVDDFKVIPVVGCPVVVLPVPGFPVVTVRVEGFAVDVSLVHLSFL